MRVIVTGANGYIGLRLIPSLLEAGYSVIALVRNRSRFPLGDFEAWGEQIQVLEGDFLEFDSLPEPDTWAGASVAYYLLHSMGAGAAFVEREETCAQNFKKWVGQGELQQVVYLSGIAPEGAVLSKHLMSRTAVAQILREGAVPLTVLRASIIVGSGSASFEIIRDLVEKLPIMITPKWTRTRCQPIAIRNVIHYLLGVIDPRLREQLLGQSYDIGGDELLTYQEMLQLYAEVRKLPRKIIAVPFLSPKLSAYWLYFMTATSFPLAQALVGSLHIETTCRERKLKTLVPQELLSYRQSIELALVNIAQNRVPSVWYDSLASGKFDSRHMRNVQVPAHGVLQDSRKCKLAAERGQVIEAVWGLGGKNGWPSMDWAWFLRGLMDKLVGGAGIRRGRRDPRRLRAGDALDFWRVLVADREQGRLLLFAEMKVPGEAWLEFVVTPDALSQRAVFRPKGLLGRLYWWLTYPFHLIIFPRMLDKLSRGKLGS